MMARKSFVFCFDDVEVREREFTLIKAGKVLTVEPKAFRALLFLLHNPQRLISKEELLNSVWDDAALTEGSLTRCISLLRSRLGDDIRQPRYIVTVATVGYRFVCKVEVSEDSPRNPERAGDSRFIYFLRRRDDPGVFRVSIMGGEPEKIADLKDFQIGGWGWMGLDPTDAPLMLRDISSDDIYALTLDQK